MEQQTTAITAAGQTEHVKLAYCEMSKLSEIADVADVFGSIMTFNRLSGEDELGKMLHQAALIRVRSGAGLWFFDYARPKLQRTIDDVVPRCYPGASGPFRIRERSSMQTAFSFAEMSDAMSTLNIGTMGSANSKPVGIYQGFWLEPGGEVPLGAGHSGWSGGRLTVSSEKEFNSIAAMFPPSVLPRENRK
jgi:hypothetical protein